MTTCMGIVYCICVYTCTLFDIWLLYMQLHIIINNVIHRNAVYCKVSNFMYHIIHIMHVRPCIHCQLFCMEILIHI